jgi:hypothetical protein
MLFIMETYPFCRTIGAMTADPSPHPAGKPSGRLYPQSAKLSESATGEKQRLMLEDYKLRSKEQ